jgi:hypothetical protein
MVMCLVFSQEMLNGLSSVEAQPPYTRTWSLSGLLLSPRRRPPQRL